jgi:hypothetical protein
LQAFGGKEDTVMSVTTGKVQDRPPQSFLFEKAEVIYQQLRRHEIQVSSSSLRNWNNGVLE